MKNLCLKYIEDNKKVITIIMICILIGIISGIFFYKLLDSGTKNEFSKYITSILDTTKDNSYEGINIIKNGMFINLFVILAVYLSCITFIAPILVCIIGIAKGFSLGIYISTIFSVFGISNGILVNLLLVILVNLIYIPAYIYICCNCINFHYNIFEKFSKENKTALILKELVYIITGFSVIFLSIVIEQFSTLAVISIYKGM